MSPASQSLEGLLPRWGCYSGGCNTFRDGTWLPLKGIAQALVPELPLCFLVKYEVSRLYYTL